MKVFIAILGILLAFGFGVGFDRLYFDEKFEFTIRDGRYYSHDTTTGIINSMFKADAGVVHLRWDPVGEGDTIKIIHAEEKGAITEEVREIFTPKEKKNSK